MKKLISLFTVLLFILSGCLWFSTDTYADETKSSDSETAASETVPETQASPVILPTDKVSTDDIILYSSAACVIDVDSGEILYYKNMDDRHYPASITKVLTGLLLIENANLDDTITFSQDCWNGLNYYNDMNMININVKIKTDKFVNIKKINYLYKNNCISYQKYFNSMNNYNNSYKYIK